MKTLGNFKDKQDIIGVRNSGIERYKFFKLRV